MRADPLAYLTIDLDSLKQQGLYRHLRILETGQKPDAIFATGYYSEAAIIVRQARELGMTMPILGGDGWVGDPLKNGR